MEERRFFKLIIGAALKDFQAIEEYAYEFTKLQPEIIDISAFPSSVIYAQRGIEKAIKENKNLKKPVLMISVNSSSDPHFRRIEIDFDKCTQCLACIPSCPSKAFYINEKNLFSYNIDLCFGCSNCLEYCDYEAFSFSYWKAKDTCALNELFELGVLALEIHLGKDLESFQDFYRKIDTKNIIESFSIGSELLDFEELKISLDLIYEEVMKKHGYHKKIIIQCDGIPLSGATEASYEKDQISINNAKLLLEHSNSKKLENLYFQLAGGITEKSLKKADSQGVYVHGMAIGSYARKLISQKSNISILRV